MATSPNILEKHDIHYIDFKIFQEDFISLDMKREGKFTNFQGNWSSQTQGQVSVYGYNIHVEARILRK